MTDVSAPRILCIGMPVRDLTFRIDAMPARGAKKRAEHFAEICGGNAINAAIGIARLGGRALLTGPMGDRTEPAQHTLLDQLAREGIDATHLVAMPGLTTPVSAVMLDDSGERTIVTFRDPGLWQVKLPDAATLLPYCDAILIENRCAPFGLDLCIAARQRGLMVVVDIDRPMALTDPLLTVASHLVFSSDALRATASAASDAEALDKLAALTPAFLAGTRGPHGTIWRDEAGRLQETPSFAVQAVDTLGAGDIFHGAFALAITERQSINDALTFASAAAALKCTRFGSAFAAPGREEVEQLLRSGARHA
ncbi:MAG: sugar kinase [Rhodopseudomonas palustris]|nr:MAG: sugar kinase [Rhodopseudomonas palustris]